jgi:hypothetical protein
MKQFFKKLGLTTELQFEMKVSKSDFVNTLMANIDAEQLDIQDVFSGSQNIYKGKIAYDRFELRRRHRMFDPTMNWARLYGTFVQKDEKLIVEVEIVAGHYMMIPFFILLPIGYGIILISMLTNDVAGEGAAWGLPFLLIHGAFMMGIPYFMMKRSLRTAAYNIERDIFFLMRHKLTN